MGLPPETTSLKFGVMSEIVPISLDLGKLILGFEWDLGKLIFGLE